jgi:hypothetical protein
MSSIKRKMKYPGVDASPMEGGRSQLTIRHARDVDLDWKVRLHGQLYLEEQGWDHRFEDLVAGVVDDFRRGHDEAAER